MILPAPPFLKAIRAGKAEDTLQIALDRVAVAADQALKSETPT